ncbi:MAG: endonuclease/exonuclease/phosphatase family protein [Muribaculaceae bacterium]|nr:endonuclease/exonuclease/phosphatase family protein [Muribaculaceae bacterium]MDE5957413.1 endonuclease/exonuclease/phosphatase family protein [Muribaculaceae bacterium]
MKRKSLLLLSVLAVIAAISGVGLSRAQNAPELQKKQFQMYGVAFYNLENLFDTINNNGKYDLEFSPQGKNNWNGHKYNSKLKNLAYAISQMSTTATPMGPAIIGCSEIENESVLQDLVRREEIRKWHLQVIHHDSPDLRGVDVGLLYNPRFFQPENVTNHTLVIPELPNFKTRDQMCVVGLLGGSRVAVIVNHWPSRRGGSKQSSYLREAAAALSRSIADSVMAVHPEIGVIIMGDLNDDPHDKSCAETLGAVRNPKDCKPGGFYNPFWKKLDDGIGSYVYRGKWDLFDQIIINHNLLTGADGLKFKEAMVFNKDFLKQTEGAYKGYPFRTFSGGVWLGGFSDHFPTEIFLVKEVTGF